MRKIVIAHPYVSDAAIEYVNRVLRSRFIGQGPEVDRFEAEFAVKFGLEPACVIAVNSCTSALELAYDLLGLGPGDEVITSPLTCTATNIPLVRRGCRLVFADISREMLNLDRADVERKCTHRTKAVVNVHLNGIQSNLHRVGVPVVDDSAQALGIFRGERFSGVKFTACSFQAIKTLTTADGGMLVCADPRDGREARLRRWFGIDREKKLANNWQPFKRREILFDIEYPGYKFQMNDVAAAMGRAHLAEYDEIIEHRRKIFDIYRAAGLPMVNGPVNRYGFACLLVENRDEFCAELERAGIESNVMQVRNDRYKIFAPFRVPLPNLDWVEERYICIPLHNRMTLDDARYVAEVAARALTTAEVA
jgi:perosamine synthetase